MPSRDERNEVAPPPAGRIAGIGWGLAAGLAAATGALIGRKAIVQARVGHGHSLKHRALDMAASIMQPKYPIEAITTFLNGFHFYADDMGRQIDGLEAAGPQPASPAFEGRQRSRRTGADAGGDAKVSDQKWLQCS